MGIRELRDTLTQAIRRVRAGETIEVTHDGEPVALVVPYPDDRVTRLIVSGRARPPRPLITGIEPLPPTGPMTASEALAEDRSADR
jgi:prevent-host-death family protein